MKPPHASTSSSGATKRKAENMTGGARRKTIKSAEKVPSEQAAEFPLFTHLPAEIQQRIFMEAMRKPAVHFTEIKVKSPHEDATWAISIHPVNGSADTSSYRRLRKLGSVCPAAAKAVYFGTEAKHRLPFRGLRSAGVDTRHDLVVVNFKNTRYESSTFGPWHPSSFGASNRRLDVAHARTLLRGIANVGLKLNLGGGSFSCFCVDVPFRSLLRIPDHSRFSMCPEELAGFLDLFPDLEAVYLLIVSERTGRFQSCLHNYTEAFYKLSSSTRQSRGLAIFHDSCNAYIEYCHELVTDSPDFLAACVPTPGHPYVWNTASIHIQDFRNAVKEAMTADCHPTRPVPVTFQNPFAQRSAITFKTLLKAGGSCGRSM